MAEFWVRNIQKTTRQNAAIPKPVAWATVGALTLLLITQGAYTQDAHAQTATLNQHPVSYDDQGKLASWIVPQHQAYDQVMKLAWNFLLNDVPRDASHGNLPAYYLYPYVYGDRLYFPGWPHNPADTFYGFTESALAYYPYSGDTRVIELARAVLDFHLANGLTAATDAWASVPYASADAGSMIYNGSSTNGAGSGDGRGVIEPDKVGELGLAFLKMYLFSGDARYLTAAMNAGNALAANIRACNAAAPCDQNNSPWPFRVTAATNAVQSPYSAHVTAPIKLLDELIQRNIGNVAGMQMARQRALDWLLGANGPIATNRWDGFFEDIPTYAAGTNATNINALDAAKYLMLHPEVDPSWRSHVPAILAGIESLLGETQFGVAVMREQQQVPRAMGSHTARYAAVKALWFEKTGDLAAKEAAYRALNWATYMASANGQVIDFPGNGAGEGDSLWWTDGYGDFIQHFMAGMGSVPEWSPAGENKMLRSSAVVRSVSYQADAIRYVTADASALDVLRLNDAPLGVTAGGMPLNPMADLAAQAGWTYDAAAKVLKVRHDASGEISVTCGGAGCLTSAAPLPTPVATLVVTATGGTSPTPMPTTASSPTPTSGQQVAVFDDLVGQNRVLSETYVGINWGGNAWYLSAPWGLFTTKSVSFNGSRATSGVLTFTSAQRLISFDVYSAGTSTITVACDGMPLVQAAVVNQIKTVSTNWTGVCSAVTLTSSNGWDTNFDNFTFDSGSAPAAVATSLPTPTSTPTSAPTPFPIMSATATSTAIPRPTTAAATATATTMPTAVPATSTSTPAVAVVVISTLTPVPTATSTPTTRPATATSTSTSTSTPKPTATATARAATATPTRTPTWTPTATRTPPPAWTPSPTPSVQTLVKFDDAVGQDRVLTGQYPTGSLNWGTDNSWYLSAPWGLLTTKSVSFNGSSRKSAVLTLPTPRKLVSLKAYNGAALASAITLQCPGQPVVSLNLAARTLVTITTGWTGTCATITVTAGTGWDTNFDDLVLQ